MGPRLRHDTRRKDARRRRPERVVDLLYFGIDVDFRRRASQGHERYINGVYPHGKNGLGCENLTTGRRGKSGGWFRPHGALSGYGRST